MAKDELLGCPFCGGEAKITHNIQGRDYWYVSCPSDHCDIYAHDRPERADAIAAWNTRYTKQPDEPNECPTSPTGNHIVDTSMESGPNNCFHCEQPMGTRHEPK